MPALQTGDERLLTSSPTIPGLLNWRCPGPGRAKPFRLGFSRSSTDFGLISTRIRLILTNIRLILAKNCPILTNTRLILAKNRPILTNTRLILAKNRLILTNARLILAAFPRLQVGRGWAWLFFGRLGRLVAHGWTVTLRGRSPSLNGAIGMSYAVGVPEPASVRR